MKIKELIKLFKERVFEVKSLQIKINSSKRRKTNLTMKNEKKKKTLSRKGKIY